ncbi:MAG TPA: bifunctional hydroxymethylpyrimidine kinase/phosphomethylpyrimidine kinase [Stellaceae bacterium]|nr:bifunctional hydroxymethylpyrimidine kinase/phosphomethylpyrimidine kinase [Stellaceae bacterium]
MRGRVLIVAGSDSGGGAGIQADIKTVTALGGYAATAITALTAQNTVGVFGMVPVEASFVGQQIEVVLSDIGADCVKTGMLRSADVIATLTDKLAARAPQVPVVVDPVMVSSSGERLLDRDAVDTLKRRLLVHTTVVTPNVPEAEALTGMTIRDIDDMRRAAEMLVTLGVKVVVVKGGHMGGRTVSDLVADENGSYVLSSSRIDTRHTHGTGCTLASAIATGLAQGMEMRPAIERARRYLIAALASAPGYGQGHGPLNHSHTVCAEEWGVKCGTA